MDVFCSYVTDFEEKKNQILVLIIIQMLFGDRYKTQDYFRYFLHLHVFSVYLFVKRKGLILAYPQRIV